MMSVGLFYSSECPDLTSLNHFIMTGVYGSIAIVSLGLTMEAGLDIHTDIHIESHLVILAGLFNLVVAVLAFYEYYSGILPINESMSKGFVSTFSFFICMSDCFVLYVFNSN